MKSPFACSARRVLPHRSHPKRYSGLHPLPPSDEFTLGVKDLATDLTFSRSQHALHS